MGVGGNWMVIISEQIHFIYIKTNAEDALGHEALAESLITAWTALGTVELTDRSDCKLASFLQSPTQSLID